jgi:hypothetical protein
MSSGDPIANIKLPKDPAKNLAVIMKDVGRNKRSALRRLGGFRQIDCRDEASKRRNKAIAPYGPYCHARA